jgi:hypothetical protein
MPKRKHPIILVEWEDITQRVGPIEPVLYRRFLTLGIDVSNLEGERPGGLLTVYNYDLFKGLSSEKTGSFAFPPVPITVKNRVVLGYVIEDPDKVTVLDRERRPIFVAEKNLFERGILL